MRWLIEILIMPQSYTPEFKKKIVRLHLEEGQSYKSITAEYGVSKASIFKWCSEFSEKCRTKADINPNNLTEAGSYIPIRVHNIHPKHLSNSVNRYM